MRRGAPVSRHERVTVAALYVDGARGPYSRIPGVECWGGYSPQPDMFAQAAERDAMTYCGPHPVVAHPPCGHWGLFAWNCKQPRSWAVAGLVACRQVRRWGGVLEHPRGSHLWEVCSMPRPGQGVDKHGGRTILVNQTSWGHPCDKPTWLYVVRRDIPEIPPRQEPTHCMVRLRSNPHNRPELPKRLRHLTPPSFARWLVALAAEGATQ